MSAMFDEQIPKVAAPPGNIPSAPADIFSGVEKDEAVAPAAPAMANALSSGLLKRKEEPTTAPQSMNVIPLVTTRGPILGKILLAVGIAAVLGAAGFGGWWLYGRTVQQTTPAVFVEPVIPTPPPTIPVVAPTPEPTPIVAPLPSSTVTNALEGGSVTSSPTRASNDSILFGVLPDADRDGLDDQREKEIGTNPNNPDTDGDGLTDGDEVIIWKTNPLQIDTDGDGFPDGEEVRNGYNPLGRGRLINFVSPTSSKPATSSTF